MTEPHSFESLDTWQSFFQSRGGKGTIYFVETKEGDPHHLAPGNWLGETVIVDGHKFKVVGVETYRVQDGHPALRMFGLLDAGSKCRCPVDSDALGYEHTWGRKVEDCPVHGVHGESS